MSSHHLPAALPPLTLFSTPSFLRLPWVQDEVRVLEGLLAPISQALPGP